MGLGQHRAMSAKFEYRFVRSNPEDMSELVAAGAEGWEAVGMVSTEDALLILIKRGVIVEDRKASSKAARRYQ